MGTESNNLPNIFPYIINGAIANSADKALIYKAVFDIESIEIVGRNEMFINALFYEDPLTKKLKIYIDDDRIKSVLKPNMSISAQLRIYSETLCKITKIDLRSDSMIKRVFQCTCCNRIIRPCPDKIPPKTTYRCPSCTGLLVDTNNIYSEPRWNVTKYLPLS